MSTTNMSLEEPELEESGGEEDEGEIIDWQLPLCFMKKRYTTRANMENERESKLCCVLFTSISFIVLVKHGVCKTPVRLY